MRSGRIVSSEAYVIDSVQTASDMRRLRTQPARRPLPTFQGFGGGPGRPFPGPLPNPEPGFCERHETTCDVGRFLKRLVGAGCRRRSPCYVVSAGDVGAFKRGTIARWIVNDTAVAIGKALGGLTGNQVEVKFGYSTVAQFHMDYFVPLCGRIVPDATWSCDPNDSFSRKAREAAYAVLIEQIRTGTIRIVAKSPGDRDGGDDGSGGYDSQAPKPDDLRKHLVPLALAAVAVLGARGA